MPGCGHGGAALVRGARWLTAAERGGRQYPGEAPFGRAAGGCWVRRLVVRSQPHSGLGTKNVAVQQLTVLSVFSYTQRTNLKHYFLTNL
jgi:hypothetical protein